MVSSADGQTPAQPRTSLRINANRQSLTGFGPATGSPRTPASSGSPSLVRSQSTRVSSPGQLGSVGSPGGSPMAAAAGGGAGGGGGAAGVLNGALTSPGFGPLGSPGDLPKLPCVSESGEKNPRPPVNPLFGRSRTLTTINVVRREEPPPPAASKDLESTLALKKERNALRMDKNLLLLNKRRLEGLLTKLLDSGEEGSSSSLRAHLLQALDESMGLDQQMASTGGGGAALQPTVAFGETSAGGDAEAARTIKALEARIAQMQADHDLAMRHMESELSYRRTQATAASSGMQKQLSEALEDLERTRRKLEAAEDQVQDYYVKNSDLTLKVTGLETSLADAQRELSGAKEMLGMDKTTMNTVINMLKDQLQEANADRANKARAIAELEYAIVHRDTLLAEAHDRINAAAQQAAASSAAVARVALSMQTPLDSKNSWGHKRTSNAGAGGGAGGGGGGSHERLGSIGSGGLGGGGGGGGGGNNVAVSPPPPTSLTKHHSHRRIVTHGNSSSNGGSGAGGRGSGGGGGGATAAGGKGPAAGGAGRGAAPGGGEGHHLSDGESYSGEGFEAEDIEE